MVKLNRVEPDMTGSTPTTNGDERAYDDLRSRVMKRLEGGRQLTAEKIDEALELATGSARSATEFTSEQIARASGRVRQELTGISETAAKRGESMRERITPSRPSTRFLLIGSVALGLGNFLLGRISRSPKRAELVKKGDVAGPGLFACRSCGTRLQMVSKGSMPRCSNCKNEKFARVQ